MLSSVIGKANSFAAFSFSDLFCLLLLLCLLVFSSFSLPLRFSRSVSSAQCPFSVPEAFAWAGRRRRFTLTTFTHQHLTTRSDNTAKKTEDNTHGARGRLANVRKKKAYVFSVDVHRKGILSAQIVISHVHLASVIGHGKTKERLSLEQSNERERAAG